MKTSVFDDACDEIYEVLLPRYHFMTQNSRACFLYMAVFPNNDAVRHSRIINFWRAEAFAHGLSHALDCIISSNLDVVSPENMGLLYLGRRQPKAKACNLHIVYRYLSRREGESIKFMCILNRYADGLVERVKDMLRLAIHHNTLLAIKEVRSAIASVSSLRSVLCTGPYHQYQVLLCLKLKLLRVLDVLTIRFYEFPAEVVKLIRLKYLSLTTNANLPPSIYKLCFLQFLIVHQHLSINGSGVAENYVPVEIWELQELEHLHIIGRNLPHPPHQGAILPILLDVGVETICKGVLENVPKLEKLRIQIELPPIGDRHSHIMSCFDHIFYLQKLTSLQCVIRNPVAIGVPPRLPLDSTMFCRLEKLSLSGFGYP